MSATKIVLPEANVVSRVLNREHTRSTTTATRVRGYRKSTRGFRVTGSHSGAVHVEHIAAGTPDFIQDDTKVRAYAETLRSAGYEAVVAGAGSSAIVRVTGRRVPA